MTVKELKELLGQLPENAEIVIAPAPDVGGWVAHILPFFGFVVDKRGGDDQFVVLGPREAMIGEVRIDWPERPV